MGLDTEAFNGCLDAGTYSDTVLNETRWAQSVGVQSTPTIVVNGYVILGAQPMAIFEDIFNNYLDN